MKTESSNLDLLRSVAVAIVVLSHTPGWVVSGWSDPEGYSRVVFGRIGVAIFFVHTTLVLLQSLERSGGAAGPFFVRRFFRIYPLAVAVVLISAGMFALAGKPLSQGELLSNLLLIQNLTGHDSLPVPQLWSLPYEVQMYLVLPMLYAVTRMAMPVLRILLLAAAAMVAWTWMGATLLQFVPCFLAGAIAHTLPRGNRSPWLIWLVVGVGIAVIPALSASGVGYIPLFWAFCLALGLVIPMCREVDQPMLARVGKTVAKYSYGVYLTHMHALGIPFSGGHGIGSWVLLAVLLPGLAWLAYHAIEAPGIRLGVRLAKALETRSVLGAFRRAAR